MKRVILLLTAVTALVAFSGCMGSDLESRAFLFGSNRKRTLNDVMQSWVGSHADSLITQWGVPQASYKRQDGSVLLTWKEVVEGNYSVGICEKTFLAAPDGTIERWKYSGLCRDVFPQQDYVPKSTPIPQPTL